MFPATNKMPLEPEVLSLHAEVVHVEIQMTLDCSIVLDTIPGSQTVLIPDRA